MQTTRVTSCLPLRFHTCRTVCQSQTEFDTIAVKEDKKNIGHLERKKKYD